MNFTVDYQKGGGIFMFLATPSGPPSKSIKNKGPPLVFSKIPSNPCFWGGGGRAAKAASCRAGWGRTLAIEWWDLRLDFLWNLSLSRFLLDNKTSLDNKCSDEERSTWSGGQRATWLWYDTDLDCHRASARAWEPQLHISSFSHFYHNLFSSHFLIFYQFN